MIIHNQRSLIAIHNERDREDFIDEKVKDGDVIKTIKIIDEKVDAQGEASTATVMPGNFLFIWRGSSPYSLTFPSFSTSWKPPLLRLCPLDRTAMLRNAQSSLRSRVRRIISVCGVLPVPPAVMLPTQMVGTSQVPTLKMPWS